MAKPLVVGVVITQHADGRGASLVPYPSLLDVPYELVEHVSWLVHTRRHELRSPWRKLSCFKQALLTLAHLRKHETLAQVGAGFGVSEATAWRYVDEMLEVLAAWAPGPYEALVGPGEGDFVIVDGTHPGHHPSVPDPTDPRPGGPTAPTRVPAPLSAPSITTTTNSPSTTRSSTVTTPGCGFPANAPSRS